MKTTTTHFLTWLVHPLSLIRIFAVHMKKNFASLAIQNAPKEVSDQIMNVQVDLYLPWVHMSIGTFSDVATHLTSS